MEEQFVLQGYNQAVKEEELLAEYYKTVQRTYKDMDRDMSLTECLIQIIEATKLAREQDLEGFRLMKKVVTTEESSVGYAELKSKLFANSHIERAIVSAQEHGLVLPGDPFSIFHGFVVNVFFQIDLAYTFNNSVPNNEYFLSSVIVGSGCSFEKINNKLYHDPLTGAYNRLFLNECCSEQLENTAIAMVDLDYLKDINDVYGHKAGDMALEAVVKTIDTYIRKNDHLIRFGGDEFILIMHNIPEEVFGKKLELVSNAIKKLSLEAYPNLQLSVTIGGVYGSGAKREMMEQADKLLYKGKEHRGSILIKAMDGSRIRFYGLAEAEEPTTPMKSLAELSRGFKRTLLVVEDNDINREVLAELLAEDYNVLQAENGAVGLELLQKHLADVSLVILDVQMPVMDGYEFLEIVKNYPLLSEVPILVATGNDRQEEERKCLALGASDFVTKPYNTEILKSRIASIIRLKESAATMSALQTDERTGLYSFQAFCYYAKQIIDSSAAASYSVTIFDVNRFRLINENYGEDMGNHVLRMIAKTVKKYTAASDIYGRYGAARFLILNETMSSEETKSWLKDLFAKIKQACGLNGLTFKAGVYDDVDKSLSIATICDRAIAAMNSVDQSFEDSFAIYDKVHAEKERRLAAMESSMQEAYATGQFSVYYQPKHDTFTGKLVGAEALVRWIHPEFGFLSPAEFIPLFERNGFIAKVDYYVLKRTCKNLRAWMEEGLTPVPISVNASRRDFDYEDFLNTALKPLKKYAISPELVHLEVTESLFSDRIEQMSNLMQSCREAGFKIELDDFGIGYSSLTTLASLPLDVLKLDMSFMRNYKDEKKMKVLATCISLGKSLGLKTVSEGVENEEQLSILKRFGSDYIQGYYFSKPLPEEEFKQYMLACAEE